MLQPKFIIADSCVHRDEIIELNIEYLLWVFAEIDKLFDVSTEGIVGMPVREYVPTVINKVCGDPPPKGIFYLVKVGEKLAGMGGMRSLGADIGEVKRIYIRPEFRGKQLGDLMLKRLLSNAISFGYKKMRLDTGLFMKSAHRVYESNGFVDCSSYEGAEVPPAYHSKWRFMERML